MNRHSTFQPAEGDFEYQAEPDAGVLLSSGEKWWGTRIRYRVPPAKRWERMTILDVHPFDLETIEHAIRERLTGRV